MKPSILFATAKPNKRTRGECGSNRPTLSELGHCKGPALPTHLSFGEGGAYLVFVCSCKEFEMVLCVAPRAQN